MKLPLPRFTFIAKLVRHLRALKPSDQLIALVLGVLFLCSLLTGLYTLERTFLVEVPGRGGSLIEGQVGSPRFVNPLLALSDADRDLSLLTYAGLMGYDKDGTLVPVLAETYEVSPDGTVYTFRIRETAKFSDGTPVTAEDVVFTVQKAQDPKLKSPELANWSNILAEAVDARTVRFTLPKAYAPFLEDATLGILPAHLWHTVAVEEFPFSPLMEKPVGAGPFEVASVMRNKDGTVREYRLRAFDGYALGRAYLDSFTFVYFDNEEDLTDALLRGRVESAYGIPAKEPLQIPYSRVIGVFFNQGQNPLFARLEVRKALSVAVDRTALVQTTLGGYATPVDGPVPPGSLPPEAAGIATTSVTAADILTNAGWEKDENSGTWKLPKEGLELTVTLKTANVPELKVIADRLKDEWGAAGIPVSIELSTPSELAATVIRPRKYEALLFGMVVGRDRDLYAFWHSSQRNDPGLNIALYTRQAVDDLLETIREERDTTKLPGELAELDALIASDYPAVFLEAPDFLYSFPKDLHGVSIAEVATPSDRLIGAAFWYRHMQWVWPVFAKSE